MTRLKILFIILLLFLTSRAKPFKESTTDNENTSQAINVTPSGLVNEIESLTFYIKNDDILSISEFSRMFNPGENLFNNVQFIKEPDSDYVEKVRSKNIKTTLEIPKLEDFNEESETDKNVDATIVDSEKESRKSKSEGLSTEIKEFGSTTISIKGHGRSGEESYEDDLEVPENIESTERYFKNDNDKRNSRRRDEIKPLIQLRRSLLPNEEPLLDTKAVSNKSEDIVDVAQDTEKSDVLNKKPNEQNKVENTSETPSVVSQLNDPDPAVSDKQFDNLSSLFTGTDPADLKEISNEETTKFGDEYIQSDNLDKSEKIITKEKTIDDFNTNIHENAYPYTPPNVESTSRQSLTKQPNLNSLYSKLPPTSRHPSRNRVPSGQSFRNYGTILPNFNQQNRYLQNIGLYNLVPRTRRFFSCDHCGEQQHEHHMYIH